jgi:hypothetical protein
MMTDILKKLEGGDRRSIGQVAKVVDAVIEQPALFETVFKAMLVDDPIVRMRQCQSARSTLACCPNPSAIVTEQPGA